MPFSLMSVAFLYAALTLPLAWCNRRHRRLSFPKITNRGSLWRALLPWKNPVMLAGMAFFGVLFGMALLTSLTRAYSTYDGIANWTLKGYGMALERSIFAGAKWGGHVLSYPQNLPLTIAMFRLADGDILPGSKLLFPLFAFSLFLGINRHLRAMGTRSWISLLWIALLAILILTLRLRGRRPGFRAWAALPFALIPAAFLAFSLRSLSSDEIGRTLDISWAAVASGRFNLAELQALLRYAAHNTFSAGPWGLFYPVTALVLLAGIIFTRRRMDPQTLAVAVLAPTAAIFPLAMFYVASFDKTDFLTFLNVSFERAFLPATMLFGTLAALTTEGLMCSPPSELAAAYKDATLPARRSKEAPE